MIQTKRLFKASGETSAKMRARDLMGETLAGLTQRTTRSMLTMLGTVLGIGSVVAIIGLTQTANAQISSDFSLLDATQLSVISRPAETATATTDPFPTKADDLVAALNGVTGATTWWSVPVHDGTISRLPSSTTTAASTQIYAGTATLPATAELHITRGTPFTAYDVSTAQRTVMLSDSTAKRLGITSLADQPSVFIDGYPFAVGSIYTAGDRLPQLALGAILPSTTAAKYWSIPFGSNAPKMLVAVKPGAAQQVGKEIPLALDAARPANFESVGAQDPLSLRRTVSTKLNALMLTLAGVALVIGAVGIANTTLVSVLERTSEIGLRRALGARRVHVILQFLLEAATLGLLGALIGDALGVGVILGITISNDWSAALSPQVVLLAPVLGVVVGLLAGGYPAQRAGSVVPAAALRDSA